jgi:hypothetical protein
MESPLVRSSKLLLDDATMTLASCRLRFVVARIDLLMGTRLPLTPEKAANKSYKSAFAQSESGMIA